MTRPNKFEPQLVWTLLLGPVWILEIEFHYNNRDLDMDQLS